MWRWERSAARVILEFELFCEVLARLRENMLCNGAWTVHPGQKKNKKKSREGGGDCSAYSL